MGEVSRRPYVANPVAEPAATVGGTHGFRFTVITDGLLRYEWAPDNQFEDRPSAFAFHRRQPVPQFRVKETVDHLEIITSRFHLTYDKQEFSPSGLSAAVKGTFGCHSSLWRYGDRSQTLGGTARTLDEIDGRTEMGHGIISKNGHATIDDSASMVFESDGFVACRPPREGRIDGYLFSYGRDYRAALKAFYAISGFQPLLPRWALGNWWSRYYAYTADEYLSLMDMFREKGIPLSVAVLDMDWHLVKDPRIAETGTTGWTGYTWNKELFPNPAEFLASLHRRNLKTALNDHPADGVQKYEDLYNDMAIALDHDTSTGDPIAFDITNRRFLRAFFDVLHRSLEDDGVDFWWVDWQQGEYSRIKGIDPLWLLNHYHFLDNERGNKRPLIFSRYAGPGSHRYPVGFSGDTIVTWASLDFQPEFTATASNIGYGWWSHDIGGHMHGIKDDELGTRWVQLGVFSPIMRLHSSNSSWTAKEPWKFPPQPEKVMTDFLRLRHRLLPYLYNMNVRSAIQGEPIIQPMYWEYPFHEEAYQVRNQYLFGSELIVIPITTPQDRKLRLGKVKGWLPPGRYVDFFTGVVYDGDRELWINRPLDGYPVFMKEGSIVPLDAAGEPLNGGENPKALEIMIAIGADGTFEILEDDGDGSSAKDIRWTTTPIKYTQATGFLEIGPVSGPATIQPAPREWIVRFLGHCNSTSVRVLIDGVEKTTVSETVGNGLLVKIGAVPPAAMARIELGQNPQLRRVQPSTLIWPILDDAQIEFDLKENIWQIVTANVGRTIQISRLSTLEMDNNLLLALFEFILADGRL